MAKLAIQSFCRRFSTALAPNKFQLRRLTARALELALGARDWPQVAACKAELHAFEVKLAAGLSVGTHLPFADNELPDICFMALAPNFTTSAFPIPDYFTFKNFC